jgi:hypothetical protein
MTIRSQALEWLAGRGTTSEGHIVASKRYAPEESWTAEKAWWIQVPSSAIRADKEIHILCEAERGAGTFRHLKVPASYFQEHLDELATIGDDKINLFLSAEPGAEFRDERGPGHVSFAQFEQI